MVIREEESWASPIFTEVLTKHTATVTAVALRNNDFISYEVIKISKLRKSDILNQPLLIIPLCFVTLLFFTACLATAWNLHNIKVLSNLKHKPTIGHSLFCCSFRHSMETKIEAKW